MSEGEKEDAVREFPAELMYWRKLRRYSQKALAELLSVGASYISHLEAGRAPGSAQVVRDADRVLQAGGALWAAWERSAHRDPGAEETPAGTGTGLQVLDDDAELRFNGSVFHLTMRRRLINTGAEPVTRYLVRISVNRYPHDPERAKELYRVTPLSFAELGLRAYCDGREMDWTVKQDLDAVKEVWLEFSSPRGRFPLYQWQETEITYGYSVHRDKWGPWFQRAVRLPTRRLAVTLSFPNVVGAQVWGTQASMTETDTPLRTPLQVSVKDDHTRFSWSTLDPPLNTRYRLEWNLAETDEENTHVEELRDPAALMANAGIVQEGHPQLAAPARPFDLPAEADAARELVAELRAAAEQIRTLHTFGKGMGIAAPQIGSRHSDRAAAIVIPPDPDADLLVLLNPVVADESRETDEQFEGCLSFFGVRGRVPRPRRLEVAYADYDGNQQVTEFRDGMARLVAHEIDHLNGLLYRSRMHPGVDPIPYAQYTGTGSSWSYG